MPPLRRAARAWSKTRRGEQIVIVLFFLAAALPHPFLNPIVPTVGFLLSTLSVEYFKKKWFVYMLFCDQKTFYVGMCTNVSERLAQHRNKKSFYTKKFSDIQAVYCEKYDTSHQAALRERQIKGWSRAKKQMLIDGKAGINSIELDEVLCG